MKKEIVTNIKALKVISEEVSYKEAKGIIKDLEDSLDTKRGIGLSAIQIGVAKRVGIIRIKELRLDLINTVIIHRIDKFRMIKEGCLSFPNLQLDTKRYATIDIVNNGKQERYKGIIAVCIAHEVDHMNGITILDRKWRRG